jgi:ATP-dependent Clp protease ATP-binding subunit ClpA
MSDSAATDPDSDGIGPTVQVIFRAQTIAATFGHEYVTLEHLLASLVEREDIIELMGKLNVNAQEIAEELQTYFKECDGFPITATQPRPTESLDELLHFTVAAAKLSSRGKPSPSDFLLNIIQMPPEDSFAVYLLLKKGMTPLNIKKLLMKSSRGQGHPMGRQSMDPDGMPAQIAPINSREEAEEFIEQYATNLNKKAANSKIDPLIGRALEVETIVQVVSRRTKNNAILVGEPGVGKTAIAEGLALKIVRKEVPEILLDTTVYSLEIANVVAGTRFRGDFEERMKHLLKALEYIPDSILFIDEIHTVMGAGSGSQGSLDVANILKPALANGTLRCIGSTTLEEFRKHFEKDRALLRRFKRVDVEEPSVDDSKMILRGLAPYYEEFHGVKFTPEALDAAVDLTQRYVNNAYLPDKAIDVIDSAGSRQRVAPADKKKIEIGVTEIEEEVARMAHIPAKSVAEDEKDKLANLEGNLHEKVFGQNQALETLAGAVYLQRAGLKKTSKPAGAYLFAGPTGVGKTETAKTLAETLGVPLLRYDMSEYMEKHSVSKLIGSPPGYVGYGEGNAGSGKLINDVETSPYAVLLLDEIEKAHPDVFNLFLQVMDNGKLTSASGKAVYFRNIILIMTTNAGATELQKNNIGFGKQENVNGDDSVINKMFSPEFRNRLDAIVKFKTLDPIHMLSIVDKFVLELNEMSSAREVTLDIDQESREWLAKKGYDRLMGARPLERVVTENISKPLSRLMLFGALAGGGVAKVRLDGEKLLVSV